MAENNGHFPEPEDLNKNTGKRLTGKTGRGNDAGRQIKVLFAASEVYPFIKTGGLADVAGYLPVALQELGIDIRIVLPAYRQILENVDSFKPLKVRVEPDTGMNFRLLKGQLPGSKVPVYLVDVPDLFDRNGGPYQDPAGQDWPDNASRFALFSRVIRLISQNRVGLRWQPDILHCNDWHTGLAPALLSMDKRRPAIVFSIHNLAYLGDFSYDVFKSLNLPDSLWSFDAMEFHGRFSFIKGGLVYADRLIAVSPEYTREIRTADFGYGLEGLLNFRKGDLLGILNGVDYRYWNPQYDPYIKKQYTLSNLKDKKINKLYLQKSLGLAEDENAILLAHISRLNWQKGIDLILNIIDDLLQIKEVQLVVLGTGEDRYEKALQDAANRYSDRVAVRFTYDEKLAHEIQAGTDILLMPSRFEPCGLTQMYSLRYGTIPVVRRTGGLVDTINDTTPDTLSNYSATGFQFTNASAADFLQACRLAIKYFRVTSYWRQIMSTAMQKNFSWKKSAGKYRKVYLDLLKARSSKKDNMKHRDTEKS